MIPYGRQDINQDDINAVIAVLESDFLTQGPMVPRFEEGVAKHVGARHALAVNSATSALHIACLALGLGPGDWLWTSPVTFVASANCGLYCGAKVDFVDINPLTFNLCPVELQAKLEVAELEGRLPKVVVAVHLCGQPCDMEAIQALGQRFGFKIIEDASHAIGGKYKGDFIGNGRYSDITVFSFHPVKIITTAEGGMALTNNDELARRYDDMLADLHVVTPWQDPDGYSGLHLYVIRLQLDKIGKSHREVFKSLREQGIGVNLHYIPVHIQPYYQQMGFKVGDYPKAEHYYAEAISLPMFQTMTDVQQDEVVTAVRKATTL